MPMMNFRKTRPFMSFPLRFGVRYFLQKEQHVPEGLEELNKFDEAHCAVRYHEILKSLETAFAPTVP